MNNNKLDVGKIEDSRKDCFGVHGVIVLLCTKSQRGWTNMNRNIVLKTWMDLNSGTYISERLFAFWRNVFGNFVKQIQIRFCQGAIHMHKIISHPLTLTTINFQQTFLATDNTNRMMLMTILTHINFSENKYWLRTFILRRISIRGKIDAKFIDRD